MAIELPRLFTGTPHHDSHQNYNTPHDEKKYDQMPTSRLNQIIRPIDSVQDREHPFFSKKIHQLTKG
jgi:hypothetical protein